MSKNIFSPALINSSGSWEMPPDTILAVIGDPIGHSLSPAMHNPILEAAGIKGSYAMAEVKKEDLQKWCSFAAKNLKGFNVTVPHKENIIPFLDRVEPAALAAGSVNTVRIAADGALEGTTTDGAGFLDAAAEALHFSPADASVAITGAGGAARGIAFACAAAGAKEILIFNRNQERAEILAADLKNLYPALTVSVWKQEETTLPGLLAGCDLTVQATSLGLKESDPSPLPEKAVKECRAIFECIYGNTEVLHYALDNNVPCTDGAGMLLHQGARAFEFWFGRKPDTDIMKKALLDAVRKR